MKPPEREIFIVDDDLSVRESLAFLLASAGYSSICFADGEALKAATRSRCPACILLDINLPGRSGLEILKEFREDDYPAPIVMMTGAGTIDIAVRALKTGAADFIEKPFLDGDLLSRLEKAMTGGSNGAPNLEAMARQNFPGRQPLTRREREVFHLILKGQSDKDISRGLGISPRTAEVHRAAIIRKLGARGTADLLRIAFTQQVESSAGGSELPDLGSVTVRTEP